MFVVFDQLMGNSGVFKPEVNIYMFWCVNDLKHTKLL